MSLPLTQTDMRHACWGCLLMGTPHALPQALRVDWQHKIDRLPELTFRWSSTELIFIMVGYET